MPHNLDTHIITLGEGMATKVASSTVAELCIVIGYILVEQETAHIGTSASLEASSSTSGPISLSVTPYPNVSQFHQTTPMRWEPTVQTHILVETFYIQTIAFCT